MSRYLKKIAVCLSLAILVLGAGQALAVNDARSLDQAKISLSQAIASAEQHVGGQAAKAEFDNSTKHGLVYEVEVVKGTKIYDVKIDAQSGKVISSVEDMED